MVESGIRVIWIRPNDDPARFDNHLPALQGRLQRDDAYQCLPILLRLQALWRCLKSAGGGLLRLLLVR